MTNPSSFDGPGLDVVLRLIVNYVDPRTLISMSETCRTFSEAVRGNPHAQLELPAYLHMNSEYALCSPGKSVTDRISEISKLERNIDNMTPRNVRHYTFPQSITIRDYKDGVMLVAHERIAEHGRTRRHTMLDINNLPDGQTRTPALADRDIMEDSLISEAAWNPDMDLLVESISFASAKGWTVKLNFLQPKFPLAPLNRPQVERPACDGDHTRAAIVDHYVPHPLSKSGSVTLSMPNGLSLDMPSVTVESHDKNLIFVRFATQGHVFAHPEFATHKHARALCWVIDWRKCSIESILEFPPTLAHQFCRSALVGSKWIAVWLDRYKPVNPKEPGKPPRMFIFPRRESRVPNPDRQGYDAFTRALGEIILRHDHMTAFHTVTSVLPESMLSTFCRYFDAVSRKASQDQAPTEDPSEVRTSGHPVIDLSHADGLEKLMQSIRDTLEEFRTTHRISGDDIVPGNGFRYLGTHRSVPGHSGPMGETDLRVASLLIGGRILGLSFRNDVFGTNFVQTRIHDYNCRRHRYNEYEGRRYLGALVISAQPEHLCTAPSVNPWSIKASDTGDWSRKDGHDNPGEERKEEPGPKIVQREAHILFTNQMSIHQSDPVAVHQRWTIRLLQKEHNNLPTGLIYNGSSLIIVNRPVSPQNLESLYDVYVIDF